MFLTQMQICISKNSNHVLSSMKQELLAVDGDGYPWFNLCYPCCNGRFNVICNDQDVLHDADV